ncbi:MAG: tetratricopeptide repeat-containing sensor histidine kinase [Verrucomicrobia bacterium]|nr:tetratricopeptide repeat-containing sensor histidine kinase [Cytophagales bacterium]
MKYFVWLFFWCFGYSVSAQISIPTSTDSLQWYLRTQPQDTSYIRALRNYAFMQIIAHQSAISDSLIQKIEELGKKKKFIRTDFFVYSLKSAQAAYEKTDVKTALSYALKAMEEVEKHKLEDARVGTLSNISGQYQKLDDMQNAMKYAMQAVSLMEEKKSTPLAGVYASVANILISQKRFTEALPYLLKGYHLDSLKNNARGMAILDSRLGMVYDETGQRQLAMFHHKRGLKMAEDIKFELLVADFCNQIGVLYKKEENYKQAEIFFQRAETISRKLNLKPFLKTSLQNLGELYSAEQKFIQALTYFKEATEIAEEMNELEAKYSANHALSVCYANLKDYTNAYQFARKADLLKDTLHKLAADATTQEMLNKYQSEKKQQQIVLLEKEGENKNLLLENEKRNNYLLFGFLGFSLLVAGLLLRSYRIKQKGNKVLGEKNEELLALNEELGLINERLDEANRTKSKLFSVISHDLRSPMSQLITYLNLQKENPELLDKATQAEFEQSLRESSESLLFTLEDLLSWSKSQMDHFSLFSESIQADIFFKEVLDFHQKSAADKQISLVADFSENLTFATDPNFLKVILRNLLANAIKFTPRQGQVSLTATIDTQILKIQVIDTGKGISEQQLADLFNDNITSSASGWGLKITKEFTEKLGGNLQVNSELGKGTTFQVKIPV